MKKKKPENKSSQATKKSKQYSNTATDQCQRLLTALREKPISTDIAREELDIMMPAARVFELRYEQGFNIITNWKTIETKLGKHRVAEYVLHSGKWKGRAAA